jgi:hypothetical protein
LLAIPCVLNVTIPFVGYADGYATQSAIISPNSLVISAPEVAVDG